MKKSRGFLALLAILLVTVGMSYVAYFGVGDGKTGAAKNIKQGLDLAGGVSITYQVVGEEQPSTEDMADTIYKLQQRVEGYSTEAQVYQEGDDRINIEIPGVSDANAILTELGRPGSLYFIAQTDSQGNENYSLGIDESGNIAYVLNKSIEELQADGSIVLNGNQVDTADAAQQQDEMGNTEFVVSLILTADGKQAFADATTKAFQNAVIYFLAFINFKVLNIGFELQNACFLIGHAFLDTSHQRSATRTQGIVAQRIDLLINDFDFLHIRHNLAHVFLRFIAE